MSLSNTFNLYKSEHIKLHMAAECVSVAASSAALLEEKVSTLGTSLRWVSSHPLHCPKAFQGDQKYLMGLKDGDGVIKIRQVRRDVDTYLRMTIHSFQRFEFGIRE